MINKNIRDIIRNPILTEQSMHKRSNDNIYEFKVATDANKIEIKNAIQEVFKVSVLSVKTANYDGKVKRQGANLGKRSSWKKAFVKVKAGEEIKAFDGSI